ncbi:MAG: BNR repeat-containing protein [Chitinophagaceae bacterium]
MKNVYSIMRVCFLLYLISIIFSGIATGQDVAVTEVDNGWANNSVNTVVFRKNSLVTFNDQQFIAFYDKEGFVVVGKRKTGSVKWQLKKTIYRGNVKDAHNCISIMVDGAGYLHIAWDHHNNQLNYCKSKWPYSLDLSDKMQMTGLHEQSVSYPEFYKLSNDALLFLYRDGGSGRGNLVINQYDSKTKRWAQLHDNLIDGEGKRNAYWQAFIDSKGDIHISWVWRENPDVASNHDMCYAKSSDGGKTWITSKGEKYQLPITAATAEYACNIPQKSELINQTSMFADAAGNPFIATYWRETTSSIPQYHVIYKKDNAWRTADLGFRKITFSLSGTGTKRIPISRPQVITWKNSGLINTAVIFRDTERDNKVSIAICNDLEKGVWVVKDIYNEDMGSWEPTYDTELWKQKEVLNLFIQKVEQTDREGISNMPPQMIKVMEWRPEK